MFRASGYEPRPSDSWKTAPAAFAWLRHQFLYGACGVILAAVGRSPALCED